MVVPVIILHHVSDCILSVMSPIPSFRRATYDCCIGFSTRCSRSTRDGCCRHCNVGYVNLLVKLWKETSKHRRYLKCSYEMACFVIDSMT